MNFITKRWLALYVFLLSIYSVFSFSLTAPNLILSKLNPYIKFQYFMWETFFNNRQLLSLILLVIFFLLFIIYILLVKSIKTKLSKKQFLVSLLLLIMPLFFSYNALSHDVFNYIFNAKIIMVYKANPHVKVALDYAPIDDWVRFMHNIHTPAPYGYGWTALSTLPYVLGQNRFLTTWLSFRLFSVISIFLLYLSINFLQLKSKINLNLKHLPILFFNPLFLIEIVSNSHNDLWMLIPAILSIGLIIKKPKIYQVVLSIILLFISIAIKFATLVLIPIWLVLLLNNYFKNKFLKYFYKYWPSIAAILLFLPLLTPRSQQFHPWYLVWVLVWIPFIKSRNLLNVLIAFSITSLLRYLPQIFYGEYSFEILKQQKIITWCFPILLFIILTIISRFRQEKSLK
jgi:hypothetical protein